MSHFGLGPKKVNILGTRKNQSPIYLTRLHVRWVVDKKILKFVSTTRCLQDANRNPLVLHIICTSELSIIVFCTQLEIIRPYGDSTTWGRNNKNRPTATSCISIIKHWKTSELWSKYISRIHWKCLAACQTQLKRASEWEARLEKIIQNEGKTKTWAVSNTRENKNLKKIHYKDLLYV